MKLLTLMFLITCQVSSGSSIRSSIEEAAGVVGIPSPLLSAVCFVESKHNPNLITLKDGKSASYGLCQIKMQAIEHLHNLHKVPKLSSPQLLQNPYINAFYAAAYLKYQYGRYGQNWLKAVEAYNRGSFKSLDSQYINKVLGAL